MSSATAATATAIDKQGGGGSGRTRTSATNGNYNVLVHYCKWVAAVFPISTDAGTRFGHCNNMPYQCRW